MNKEELGVMFQGNHNKGKTKENLQQIYRQTDRQTDRQTERQIRHRNRRIDGGIQYIDR